MFLNELSPFWHELSRHPIAFLGGFASGVLRLNLTDDPVRSWLNTAAPGTVPPGSNGNGKNSGNGPKSISID
jgi:hypothetical protein